MTAPNEAPRVTQAAREAAASRLPFNSDSRRLAEIIRAGDFDGHGLVQAFARFEAKIREEAVAAAKAEKAELVEALRFYRDEWEQDCDAQLIGPSVWDGGMGDLEPTAKLRADGGAKARTALAKLREDG